MSSLRLGVHLLVAGFVCGLPGLYVRPARLLRPLDTGRFEQLQPFQVDSCTRFARSLALTTLMLRFWRADFAFGLKEARTGSPSGSDRTFFPRARSQASRSQPIDLPRLRFARWIRVEAWSFSNPQ